MIPASLPCNRFEIPPFKYKLNKKPEACQMRTKNWKGFPGSLNSPFSSSEYNLLRLPLHTYLKLKSSFLPSLFRPHFSTCLKPFSNFQVKFSLGPVYSYLWQPHFSANSSLPPLQGARYVFCKQLYHLSHYFTPARNSLFSPQYRQPETASNISDDF